MRDNHEGLPEILDTVERDGNYFGVVQIGSEENLVAFEFGIDSSGYRALRRVLQTKPFETLGSGACRYYFVPSVRRLPESGHAEFEVRIEQGSDGRQFTFKGSLGLVANLMWFFELKDLASAAHLRQVSARPRV
jgi:hypothetical protein